jgi:outer membrane protein OmpA-like peptidoglycan-associated protein
MTRMLVLALLGLVAVIAGCTTNPDGTQQVNRTAVGAGVGAVVGGIVGNRIDQGDRIVGTAVGAAVGAAAGGAIGNAFDVQEAEFKEQLAAERAANAVEVERVRDDLLKLTLDSEVSFDFDSARVTPAFEPTLVKLADVLKKHDRNRITIVGHTDSVGPEAYNEDLSLRRAEAVRAELISQGVPAEDLIALGKGESQPRATNETEAGRQLNRRVEILIQPETA